MQVVDSEFTRHYKNGKEIGTHISYFPDQGESVENRTGRISVDCHCSPE